MVDAVIKRRRVKFIKIDRSFALCVQGAVYVRFGHSSSATYLRTPRLALIASFDYIYLS